MGLFLTENISDRRPHHLIIWRQKQMFLSLEIQPLKHYGDQTIGELAVERWICPFCNFSQIIGEASKQSDHVPIALNGGVPSQIHCHLTSYCCTNPDCKKVSLAMDVSAFLYRGGTGQQRAWFKRQLIPFSSGKPQPDYIPQALVADYDEACAIRELSPKAAATLVRRCLQGMIRDFCGIKDKKRLIDEIKALSTMVNEGKAPSGVSQESVEAIDKVRSIGNIGAHMEKDIDLIVDVDPNEARVLIELVEMLFGEWYVARHNRQEKLKLITEIADNKQDILDGAKPSEAKGS